VNPDHRTTGWLQGGELTESFTKAGYVLAVAQGVEKKTGKENQKAESKKQAVDDVHRWARV
jgi:hypothetical protein